MQKIIPITLTLLLMFFATTASADRGRDRSNHDDYSTQGKRIDRHLDRVGNRIEHRFERIEHRSEHKAHRAEAKGKYRQSEHFRARGKQLNRHLDRKSNGPHRRYNQHRHQNSCDHRVAYRSPRVTYRSHDLYNDRFAVVISQPGLWFGGSWHN